jgi:hypothetical protein
MQKSSHNTSKHKKLWGRRDPDYIHSDPSTLLLKTPGNETTYDVVKEALNEDIHHTERYPSQDLIEWIQKIRTRTTRKMGKLDDYNNDRTETT